MILSSNPDTNEELLQDGFTGVTRLGNAGYTLIRLDLSFIPSNAVVSSATASLWPTYTRGIGTVNAHNILGAWDPDTVTWDNFNVGFDAAAAGSFTSGTEPWSYGAVAASGTDSFDLTSLTQQWVSGAVANYGVLLEQNINQSAAYTYYDLSQAEDLQVFSVCYIPEQPASAFALLADDSLVLGPGSTVEGADVGVRSAVGTVEIGAGATVDGSRGVYGGVVTLDGGAIVGDVYTGQLTNGGGAYYRLLPFPAVASLPGQASSLVTGSDVEVGSGSTADLSAGAYGVVTIDAGGTLYLAGGVYDVASISIADSGSIVVEAPSVLRVAGTFSTGSNVSIGPDSGLGDAVNLGLQVFGTDSGTGTNFLVPAMYVGHGSTVAAFATASHGTAQVSDQTTVVGAVFASHISVGTGVTVVATAGAYAEGPCGFPRCQYVEGTRIFNCPSLDLPDGTTCSTGDNCLLGTTCSAGSCVGGTPKTCIPLDSCHDAGTCDSTTGLCSSPTKPDGVACSTGNACVADEACLAGVCVGTPLPTGTSCSDGEPCNGFELCDGAGTCRPGTPLLVGQRCGGDDCTPRVCSSSHQCAPGTPAADGSSCDNGSPCKAGAHCSGGRCDASANDGSTACSDGDPCNGVETCHAGLCTPGTPSGTAGACDPATGDVTQPQPNPIDLTAPTDLANAAAFLNPGSGVDPARLAVLRGRVSTPDGTRLVNVTISVVGAPEDGTVRTQLDGHFDMAVNGGGSLIVRYTKAGYVTVDRPVDVPWKDYTWLPDVVMTPVDPRMTAVTTNGEAGDYQAAQSSLVVDQDGPRHATLLFPPGTIATDRASGATLDALSVRATELTVGPTGPQAMPAPLPPATAYTYAVELSADEAPDGVEFSQTVALYVENFIGFPIGVDDSGHRFVAPMGYYDRQRGVWVPSENGIVVQLLDDYASGKIDIDGSGMAATSMELASLGITVEELTALAQQGFLVGQTLWRFPVQHFSAWDGNWPYSLPPDACQPDDASCQSPPPSSNPNPDQSCQTSGSTIFCQSQVLGEKIPITGTPYSLTYASDRVPGRREAYSITLPFASSIPASVSRIDLYVYVAGQQVQQSFQCPCAGLPPYVFTWNGRDGFGRPVTGAQPITVDTVYSYPATYVAPAPGAFPQAFGGYGGVGVAYDIQADRFRNTVSTVHTWRGTIGAWDAAGEGLGRWNVDVHHVYDPAGEVLYLGDGTHISTAGLRPTIAALAGGGCNGGPLSCLDPGPGTCRSHLASSSEFCFQTIPVVYVGDPRGLAAAPDGTVYFADYATSNVRKITPSGGVAVVAAVDNPTALARGQDGTLYVGQILQNGDGCVVTIDASGASTPYAGHCASASGFMTSFGGIHGLSVGPDGSLYVVDPGRVSRIAPGAQHADTILSTSGMYHAHDLPGLPAGGAFFSDVAVSDPEQVLAAGDGSLYVAENDTSGFILRVDPGGVVHLVAGTLATPAQPDDGHPATATTLSNPGALALEPDGTLVFAENEDRVRQIDTRGIVTTVAGANPSPCPDLYCQDGVAATAAGIGKPNAIAVAPDGSLILATTPGLGWILRVSAPLPRYSVGDSTGTYLIPSPDARQVYVFDTTGRHLSTKDAISGAVLYDFTYSTSSTSPNRWLTAITNHSGSSNVTTIGLSGIAPLILSPFEDWTQLALDNAGDLATVTNAAGGRYTLGMSSDGLLTAFSDPVGTLQHAPHVMAYDTAGNPPALPTGRLTSDSDPEGGNQSLSLMPGTSQAGDTAYTIKRTTKQDASTSYDTSYYISTDKTGVETRQDKLPGVTNPSISVRGTDNGWTVTRPDGTKITSTPHPDPRFGLLAPTYQTVTQLPLPLPPSPPSPPRVDDVTRTLDSSTCALTETRSINGEAFTTTYTPSVCPLPPAGAPAASITYSTPAGRTWTATLDAEGRIVSRTVPGFGTASYTYASDFGQPLTTTISAAGEQARTTTASYYSAGSGPGKAGRVASLTDPLSNTALFTVYDPVGRLLQETLPGGRPVAFQYDPNGNMVELDPPLITQTYGSGTTYQAQHVLGYSLLNQLGTYEVYDAAAPSTSLTHTSYDYTLDRLLGAVHRPEGDTVGFDSTNGRLNDVTLPTGERVQIDYEGPTGRVLDVTGPTANEEVMFQYNGSLLTDMTWSGPVPGTLHRNYDNFFRIQDESAAGVDVYFGYDADGLLNCLGTSTIAPSPPCAGALRIDRTSGMWLLGGTTFPVGGSAPVVELYTPNGFGETMSYTASVAGQAVYTVDYTRDLLGRISTRSESLTNTDGATTRSYVYTYTYDAAGRLTDVVEADSGLMVHYDYDDNGNRLRRHDNSGAADEIGSYDVQDRQLGYGGLGFTYTASGQRESATAMDGSGKETTYTYDALGNLRTVVLPDGTSITYMIDGQGRRVGKQVNGTLLQAWLYEDGVRIAAEVDYDTTGHVAHTKRFAYGSKANAPDLMIQDGVRYRILSDHLGSPRLVVSEVGAIVASWDWDEYGRPLVSQEPAGESAPMLPFGFAGGLFDHDTRLVRFGARDYDPNTGRWTAKDPILLAGGDSNVYAYAASDAVNFRDAGGAGPWQFFDCLYSGLGPFCVQQEINNFQHGPLGDNSWGNGFGVNIRPFVLSSPFREKPTLPPEFEQCAGGSLTQTSACCRAACAFRDEIPEDCPSPGADPAVDCYNKCMEENWYGSD
jgi:RHS repeat-associated protein